MSPAAGRRGRMLIKAIWFRCAAVLLGLAPLAACELVLRALDLGRPSRYEDPFVGFSAVHPLFVPNADGTRLEIPKARQTHFCFDSFAAEKPTDEFRIFVLGGSTVQGRPYAIQTSFTTWLELSLQAADPSRRWEVVNCGGVSYATYRLVPILEELLAYRPDLFIFCEGHNEFLEDRTYDEIKYAPRIVAWPHEQLSRLRLYTLLRAVTASWRAERPGAGRPQTTLGPEADARLDWQGGMEAYHRDEAWQRDVMAHFDFNVRRMAAICRQAGVPLLLVNPVSNLDWPPFKAEHRADLTGGERAEFDALLAAARRQMPSGLAQAIAPLRQATAIDPLHAGAWYTLGKCCLELGMWDEAREALVRAKDLDVCPLRMLEPMKQLLRDAAVQTGTPLVDADALFAALSPGGIPGGAWLVDHVHPSIEGHQVLAAAVADELARMGLVKPGDGWSARRDELWGRHSASLDTLYYLLGQQRLRNEQGWAHGLSEQPPRWTQAGARMEGTPPARDAGRDAAAPSAAGHGSGK